MEAKPKHVYTPYLCRFQFIKQIGNTLEKNLYVNIIVFIYNEGTIKGTKNKQDKSFLSIFLGCDSPCWYEVCGEHIGMYTWNLQKSTHNLCNLFGHLKWKTSVEIEFTKQPKDDVDNWLLVSAQAQNTNNGWNFHSQEFI